MYVDVTDAEDTLLHFVMVYTGVTLYVWGLSLVFSLEIPSELVSVMTSSATLCKMNTQKHIKLNSLQHHPRNNRTCQ